MNAGTWAVLATGACLAGYLRTLVRDGSPVARGLLKVGASGGFVALALASGVRDTFGTLVLIGLVLSLAGDALLLSGRPPLFLAGLAVFLLAHLAYVAAFAPLARTPAWVALPIAAATALVLLWLWPRLGSMRLPVTVYALAIGAMLFLALGVGRGNVRPGALLFWLSDLAVARQRFVAPDVRNELVGLPLYYAGQLLIAAAVA